MKRSCSHSSRNGHTRGAFTLVEVMVALAIFTMMAVMLIASYLNVLSAYEAIKTKPLRDLDLRLARSALLAESDFETAQKGEQFDGATGRRVTWSSVIEATNNADLYQVTFTCELGPGGQTNRQDTETIVEVFRLLRPTWASTQNLGIDRNALRDAAKERILKEQQPSPLSGMTGASQGSFSSGVNAGNKNTTNKNGSTNASNTGDARGNQTRPLNPGGSRPTRAP